MFNADLFNHNRDQVAGLIRTYDDGQPVGTRNDDDSLMQAGVVDVIDMGAIYPATPVPTFRHVPLKSTIAELGGFSAGVTDAESFGQLGTGIWYKNANETSDWVNSPFRKGENDLGKIYSYQWRFREDLEVVHEGDMKAYLEAGFMVYGEGTGEIDGVPKHHLMFRKLDQFADIIDKLKNNPGDRRIILQGYNPADVDKGALPPCHCTLQIVPVPATVSEVIRYATRKTALDIAKASINTSHAQLMATTRYAYFIKQYQDALKAVTKEVENDWTTAEEAGNPELYQKYLDNYEYAMNGGNGQGAWKLSAVMFQRSADTVLGTPFNIASYNWLIRMFGAAAGLPMLGEMTYVKGNQHIYSNQVEAVKEIRDRWSKTDYRGWSSDLPTNSHCVEGNMIIDFDPDAFDLLEIESLDGGKAIVDAFTIYSNMNMGKLDNQPEMVE